MLSEDRGVLAMVGGVLLGLTFLIRVDMQVVQTVLVVATVILVGWAALARRPLPFRVTQWSKGRLGTLLVLLGFGVFCANLVSVALINSSGEMLLYGGGLIAIGVSGMLYVLSGGRHILWIGFVIAYTIVMMALIADIRVEGVFTDVQLFHHEAVDALVHGNNPFSVTFADIYPPGVSDRVYAEGISINGELQFGYPYFPLSLLIVVPFELLYDYRVAHGVAIIVTAILLARMTSTPMSTVSAMMFLLVSPSLWAPRNGWSDPLVLLALVVVVSMAASRPRTISIATGVMFAVKQYTAFLVIPSLLLFARPWSIRTVIRHLMISGTVFGVLTLPFLLWNPSAFWLSVVKLQFIQPFRLDSIAIPALFPDAWLALPPAVAIGTSFVVVGAASWLVAVRTPTGGQGFALGSAFVFIVALLFSKQAFVNYYFVAIGLLFTASAASGVAASSGVEGCAVKEQDARSAL